MLTFQSRFGRAEWLQPYTAPTLEALARGGARSVDVICPGFPADCLETLEEIAMEGRDTFMASGGKEYRYIACLNESPAFITALTDLCAAAHAGMADGACGCRQANRRGRAGPRPGRADGGRTLGRQAPACFRTSADAATARCR